MMGRGLSERRALTVVRMSAAALRYEPRPDRDPELRDRIVALAHRHRRYGAGMIYLKLRQEGRVVNHKRVDGLYADPYHSVEDVLLHGMGGDSGLEGEQFDGHSQMLDVGIEWVARRLWRQFLASRWAEITRIQMVTFEPSSPVAYLAESDPGGDMRIYFAGQPQSWAALLKKSRAMDKAKLPDLLWAHRELIPYLPLLFPYRFTPDLARIVDALVEDPFL